LVSYSAGFGGWADGWMEEWMYGLMGVKPGERSQKSTFVDRWLVFGKKAVLQICLHSGLKLYPKWYNSNHWCLRADFLAFIFYYLQNKTLKILRPKNV
jgi:hypothetical protein